MRRWFHRVVLSRRWLSFIVLGLSFAAFGAGTLNLFVVFKANIALLLEHGWIAAMDGGAQQLAELLLSAYASMAAYLVFKACEYRLTHWLVESSETVLSPFKETIPDEDRHPAR
ncbi:MAG: hypothetical protein ABIR94_21335 [Rubrivivax sp.]